MGPPELDCEWQDAGLGGIKRFLNRLWEYLNNPSTVLSAGTPEDTAATRRLHKFLYDFHDRIDLFKPNTAISSFMEWLNDVTKNKMQLSKDTAEKIIVSLSVMAPHMASELAQVLLGKEIGDCTWPTYDSALVQDEQVTIVVQVNGKLRANIISPRDADQAQVEPEARGTVERWLKGVDVVKVIFVPNRLINFVIGPK